MSSVGATAAEEDYLQILFWLQEAGLAMSAANVARAMQLSAPTVHEMVGRLERDGYITRDKDKAIAFTPEGMEHADARREPPPADRALPHGRPEGALGRGPRAGREPRARHVAGARGAHARASLGEAKTCPHGHPIVARHARGGRAARQTSRWAPRCACCASRTRPRTCCTTSRTPASSLGSRGRRRAQRRGGGARDARRPALRGHAERRRNGVGRGRSLTAAAHRAARAARAGQAALRPLAPASLVSGQTRSERAPGLGEACDALARFPRRPRPSRRGAARSRRPRA